MIQHIYIVKSKTNPDFLELFYSKIYADAYINKFKEVDETLYSKTKPVFESQVNQEIYYVYKIDEDKQLGKIIATKFFDNYFIKSFNLLDSNLESYLRDKIKITEEEIKSQKIRLEKQSHNL